MINEKMEFNLKSLFYFSFISIVKVFGTVFHFSFIHFANEMSDEKMSVMYKRNPHLYLP